MLCLRRQGFLLACLAFPAFLTLGCSGANMSSPVPSPTAAEKLAQQSAGKYQPLDNKTCDRLRQEMAKILKVEVTSTTAPFEDTVSQEKGNACQLTAKGTGQNFKNIADIASSLNGMLAKDGWAATNQYGADAPESSVRGFRKNQELAILTVESELEKTVKCPDNVPISTCYQQAKPEQVLYKIKLQAARLS